MGNGGSKVEQAAFNPDAPVRFSQSVLSSLQENPQTDSTRVRDRELEDERRKAEKLTSTRDAQAEKLASLTDTLTVGAPQSSSADEEPKRSGLAATFSSPWYQDHSAKKDKMESQRSHESVNKEVAALRAKLGQRKKVEQLPAGVEKAKEELVSCLRTNDRRPLDCWEEVERFKAEVGKLERSFIDRAGR